MEALSTGRYAEDANDDALKILTLLLAAGVPIDRDVPSTPGQPTVLQLAAKTGDLLMIEALLKASANLPAGWTRDDLDREALTGAARSGNGEGAIALLERGIDPNQPDKDDEFPLPWAARYGRLDVISSLLKHNAKPDLRGPDQDSALHEAAARDRAAIVAQLLTAGASARFADADHAWPLRAAVRAGASASLKLLLAAGASPNETDAKGRAALHGFNLTNFALERDASDQRPISALQLGVLPQLAAAGFDFSKLDAEGHSAIASLIGFQSTDIELLQAFVQAGSPIGADFLVVATERQRLTELEWAVKHGANLTNPPDLLQWAMADLPVRAEAGLALLKAHAPLPAATYERSDLLSRAAEAGLLDLISGLIDAGVSVDSVRSEPWPLEAAVRAGQAGAVRLLLDRGAHVTSPDPSAGTVLHVLFDDDVRARRSGSPPIIGEPQQQAISTIIGNGVDAASTNADGKTVAEIAGAAPESFVAWQRAVALVGSQETDLHRAVRNDDLANVMQLVKAGADLNAKDGLGRTPLTLALQLDRIAQAEYLLGAGAQYTTEPPNAYQVADIGYAADERVAHAFMLRMLSERLLDLEANNSRKDPTTSLGNFQSNKALRLADVDWGVTCDICKGDFHLAGNSQHSLIPIRSYRTDSTTSTQYGIVQYNISPVTFSMGSPVPNGGGGRIERELTFIVNGAMTIPKCEFDFRTQPTCYPEVEIENPNLPSDFKVITSDGAVPLPGALLNVTWNGNSTQIKPGETLKLDQSEGPITISLQTVRSKVFSLKFSVTFGRGPDIKIRPGLALGDRAASYATIARLRARHSRTAWPLLPSLLRR
jgi:ankyrin repeat protein